jgi:hypothetical protein
MAENKILTYENNEHRPLNFPQQANSNNQQIESHVL